MIYDNPVTAALSTLSLHDALPISWRASSASSVDSRGILMFSKPQLRRNFGRNFTATSQVMQSGCGIARKSTRMNSSHAYTQYAEVSLKKDAGDPLRLCVMQSFRHS